MLCGRNPKLQDKVVGYVELCCACDSLFVLCYNAALANTSPDVVGVSATAMNEYVHSQNVLEWRRTSGKLSESIVYVRSDAFAVLETV